MPELPEVEYAARTARRVLAGRSIIAARAHHPSQRRTLTAAVTRHIAGQRVKAVERRGKHQLLVLADGATLLVHFRMNGDWHVGRSATVLPPHARVSFDLDNGRRLTLVDSRALCTVQWYSAAAPPELGLGPEPEDPALTAKTLRTALARKRGPIKPALLDQKLIAGVGNIYAAEACWHARISPRAPAASLSAARVVRLLEALRLALSDGHINAGRYHAGEREIPFKVYDREGEPCARCGSAIRRIVQAGRGTWFCARCQAR